MSEILRTLGIVAGRRDVLYQPATPDTTFSDGAVCSFTAFPAKFVNNVFHAVLDGNKGSTDH